MSSTNLAPVAGILLALKRDTNGGLGKPYDLEKIAPKKREFERKYKPKTKSFEDIYSATLAAVGTSLRRSGYRLKKTILYAGIDQYVIASNRRGGSATFRIRVGSNRPTELTCKVQLKKGRNVDRGEFNLDLRDADMQDIQAFMTVVGALAGDAKFFCVYQWGTFFVLEDQKGRTIEIVLYKVGPIDDMSGKSSLVLAEIEAKTFETPEEALGMIDRLEAVLNLKGCRFNKSVAEIFAPK